MDIQIRNAQAGDALAIAGLSGQLGYPAMPGPMAERLAAILGEPGHAVLVADGGGAVVGWLHIRQVASLESEPFAEIAGLVVDETRRGQGIGRLLMAAAEAWTQSQGLSRARVRTRLERDGARRFYGALGFVAVKWQQVFEKDV